MTSELEPSPVFCMCNLRATFQDCTCVWSQGNRAFILCFCHCWHKLKRWQSPRSYASTRRLGKKVEKQKAQKSWCQRANWKRSTAQLRNKKVNEKHVEISRSCSMLWKATQVAWQFFRISIRFLRKFVFFLCFSLWKSLRMVEDGQHWSFFIWSWVSPCCPRPAQACPAKDDEEGSILQAPNATRRHRRPWTDQQGMFICTSAYNMYCIVLFDLTYNVTMNILYINLYS